MQLDFFWIPQVQINLKAAVFGVTALSGTIKLLHAITSDQFNRLHGA